MERSGLLGSARLPRDGGSETGLGSVEDVSLREEGKKSSVTWRVTSESRCRECSGTAAQ